MKLIVFLFVLMPVSFAWAAPDRAGICFQRATREANPAARDRARVQCIKAVSSQLDRVSCLKLTRGFEYSTNAEDMKSYCVFALRPEPKPADCLRAARSMDYGASRDDLVWGCLKRMNATISKGECKELARAMVFPAQKARASSYCDNEIKASYR